jgi:hypothetical protein
MEGIFSHAELDRFLERHADAAGNVDYQAASTDDPDLAGYIARIAATSPDNRPALFPTRDHRLAYWINAYNGSVLFGVLSHYPIESVRDIPRPWAFFFLPRLSGFFLFQPVVLGGDSTSLYALENRLIRRRFADPRIHFALNCASLSCPRLPRTAFSGKALDRELDREARIFLADESKLRIDPEQQTIFLSAIFDWYERDFLDWQRDAAPETPATLVAYVHPYLAPERRRALAECGDCRVEFLPYDWGLNDRATAPR